MNQTNPSKWPPAKVARLRELYATNMPMSEIGNRLSLEFGDLTNKNAVIGKVHRLGLEQRRPSRPPNPNPKKRIRVRNRRPLVKKPKRPLPPPMTTPAPMLEIAKRVKRREFGPVPLLEVTDRDCKWPLWGDERDGGAERFIFCGQPALVSEKEKQLPYCILHARVAYNK